jgi:hypothetical protein
MGVLQAGIYGWTKQHGRMRCRSRVGALRPGLCKLVTDDADISQHASARGNAWHLAAAPTIWAYFT